jgi:hypothetical protein
MTNAGSVNIELLLKGDAFTKGIVTAIQQLDELHKAGQKLGLFPKLDLSQSIKNVEQLNTENKKFQAETEKSGQKQTEMGTKVQQAAASLVQEKTAMTEAKSSAQNFNLTLQTVGLAIQGIKNIQGIFTNFKKEFIDAGLGLQVLRSFWKGTEQDLRLLRKATSDNLSDGKLLQLSNQAEDLGIKLENQALFFHLVDIAADKYGTTIEGGFAKVIAGSEGAAGALKKLGIEKSAFNKKVESLVAEYAKLNPKYDENNKLVKQTIISLDEEEQKRIRLQAIIEASGITMESLNTAQKDNVDLLLQYSVAAENAKEKIGILIGEGLIKLIKAFGLSGESAVGATGYVTAFTGALIDLLPVIAMTKLAFPGLAAAIFPIVGYLAALSAQVLGMIHTLNELPGTISAIKRAWDGENLFDIWAEETKRRTFGLIDHTRKRTGMGDLKEVDSSLDMQQQLDREARDKIEAEKKLKDLIPPGDKPPGGGKGSPGSTAEQTLDLVKLAEEQLKKIGEQLKANAGHVGVTNDLLKKQHEIEQEIFRLKTGLDVKKIGSFKEQTIEQEKLRAIFEDELELINEVTKLRAESIENEWLKRKELLMLEMSEQIASIDQKDASPELKEKLKSEVRKKFDRELGAVDEEQSEKYVSALSQGLGVAQQIGNVLGIGADKAAMKIISGLQTALSIANNVFSLLSSLGLIASGGGLFGFLKFAGGGMVPGTGDQDTIPSMLTPGELVIKKKRVQDLTNTFGPGFTNWLNGSGAMPVNPSMMIQHGGAGGGVVDVRMPDVRLKGSDIWLSWNRRNNAVGKRVARK